MNFLGVLVVAAGVTAATVSACGARTGLDVPPEEPTVDAQDADAREADARHDADADADTHRDADADIDTNLPNDCPEAGSTFIYLLTEANEVLSFYPPEARFRKVGVLSCPLVFGGATPFSMAVDRKGLAYVLYNDGELFKVSTKDAKCVGTPFKATDPSFTTFGMGFTADKSDAGESLYVLGWQTGDITATLGTIDVKTFDLTHVGPLVPNNPANGELTGAADGRLFAYAPDGTSFATFLQLDPASASILDKKSIDVPPGNAWAFAFWGGDFYLFNAPTGDHSNVTRYQPTDGSIANVTTYPNLIVGAGVSTCAPLVEP